MIFERLYIHGLVCNISKCRFGFTELSYLGHIVTDTRNEPPPEKVQAILNAKAPQNRKELKYSHGLYEWLREYVPNFANTAAPWTDLLSAKRPFYWTKSVADAFKATKALFNKLLKLARPDTHKMFTL